MSDRLHTWFPIFAAAVVAATASAAHAQTAVTWPEVRLRLEASNPSLQAGRIGIDEAKASEITAFLRPNPTGSVVVDQIGNTTEGTPFSAATLSAGFSYLHEREHKRELRRDSAEGATSIAASSQLDLQRNLLFTLRASFVQVLQAKAFRTLARDNLSNYDQVLTISRNRFQSGDIAQVDLDRLELQRVTYESDVEVAEVNLRTAKIQLLRLLNDQTTSADQFDVAGPYDFQAPSRSLEDVRQVALRVRPDLRVALEGVEKALIDHRLAVANGSTDPTFTFDAGVPSISQVWQSFQPPLRQFVGVGVTLPLRIFDRNQGEKLRTQLDVTRNERLVEAARLQVFADVDTAYTTVQSAIALLQPYKDRYLDQASRVRDTVTFSYQRGGLSLVDFFQAQQEYRAVQITYVNLIASFLNAVNQLNFAVGEEVI
jgi:cobalt-zinc-cadmium efflux system outer membrane protein